MPSDRSVRTAEAVHEVIGTYDKLPGSGALIVGEKGKLFSPDDYGARSSWR